MALVKKFSRTLLASAVSMLFANAVCAQTVDDASNTKLGVGQTRVTADHINGQMQAETQATGNVVVERDDQTINANWLRYYQKESRASVGDRFKLTQENSTIYGCNLEYNLEQYTGNASKADFDLQQDKSRLRGSSKKVEFLGKGKYRLISSKVNTCNPGDDSWFLYASSVDLDYTKDVGSASDAWLQFEGVPLFYSPWLTFPLNKNRKSGFLAPSFKSGSNGFEIAIPYYFNLAPNYDLTLTPDYMVSRGLMLGAEFRYLEPNYFGTLTTEQLPSDKQTHSSRYLWRFTHQQKTALIPGLSMNIDFTQVSDNNYFLDFGDRLSIAQSTNLNREVLFSYGLNFGKIGGGAQMLWQRYQTLQDSVNSVDVPYARLPQISLNLGGDLGNRISTNLNSEFTYFANATKQQGARLIAYPSVSWNYRKSWGFIKPKVGVHYTHYNLENFNGGPAHSETRVLPILSLDSGLYFERSAKQDAYTQTVEPRLFYVYIPTKNQNNLPDFDTSENDFNYAQLFAENRFSGSDRINGANQITAALTTRYIDNKTGLERVRFSIGQRFSFQKDDITLNGSIAPLERIGSDVLLTLGGDLLRSLRFDSSYHYNQERHTTENFESALVYNPDHGKTASIRYRYERNAEIYNGQYGKLNQLDLALQWPLVRRWYILARENYSLQEHKPLEQLAGFAYSSGCWTLRLVGHRYVADVNSTKNAVFLQLEFKNLGGIGTDPFETLRLSIPGYSKINEIPQ